MRRMSSKDIVHRRLFAFDALPAAFALLQASDTFDELLGPPWCRGSRALLLRLLLLLLTLVLLLLALLLLLLLLLRGCIQIPKIVNAALSCEELAPPA